MSRSGNIYINRTITMKIYFTMHLSSIRACDLVTCFHPFVCILFGCERVYVCMYLMYHFCLNCFYFWWISSDHPFEIVVVFLFSSMFCSKSVNCCHFVRFIRVDFKFLVHPDYLCPPSMESIDANRQDFIDSSIWPVLGESSVYTYIYIYKF